MFPYCLSKGIEKNTTFNFFDIETKYENLEDFDDGDYCGIDVEIFKQLKSTIDLVNDYGSLTYDFLCNIGYNKDLYENYIDGSVVFTKKIKTNIIESSKCLFGVDRFEISDIDYDLLGKTREEISIYVKTIDSEYYKSQSALEENLYKLDM